MKTSSFIQRARRAGTTFLIAGAGLAVTAAAWAQAPAWPARPVTVIVPTAAGGAPDIAARLLADRLSTELGQRFIIDNRPGANQIIGLSNAARAPKDGYTFVFASSSGLSMNRLTMANLPYDPIKDLVPVINVGVSPMLIAVNPDLPIKSIAELIAYAKQKPGAVNFGTIGQRNIPHVTGELLEATAQIDLVHVPYPTSQIAATDAIAGRTQVVIDGIPPLIGMVNDGRLRAIAVASAARLPGLEQIPTVAESLPGFEINGFFAVMAPAGVPQNIIDLVNQKLQVILKEPAIIAKLRQGGTYPVGGTSQDLRNYIDKDYAILERAVKAGKLEKQ
ncbi:MAG: tripartite tricarboxylate transporter substrate-binding protein [Pseudomonadota bacterium]